MTKAFGTALLVFACSTAYGQRTVITDKAEVRQELKLSGTPVDEIDSTLVGADHSGLPTSLAVKNYVDSIGPGGGSTEQADGITILGDGTGGDPFRVDTSLMVTTTTLADSAAAIRGDFPAGGSGSVDTLIFAADSGTPIKRADGETLTIAGAGIATTTASGTTITVAATEVDGSTTNEKDTVTTLVQDSILVYSLSGSEVGRDTIGVAGSGGGGVGGAGTLDYIPKWTPDGNTIGNSVLRESAGKIGLGVVPAYPFDIGGAASMRLAPSSTPVNAAGVWYSSATNRPHFMDGTADWGLVRGSTESFTVNSILFTGGSGEAAQDNAYFNYNAATKKATLNGELEMNGSGVHIDMNAVATPQVAQYPIKLRRNNSGGYTTGILFTDQTGTLPIGRIGGGHSNTGPIFHITPFYNSVEDPYYVQGLSVSRNAADQLTISAGALGQSLKSNITVHNNQASTNNSFFNVYNLGTGANTGANFKFWGWMLTPTNQAQDFASIGAINTVSLPTHTKGAILFSVRDSASLNEVVRVNPTGVGIKTNAPAQTMHVQGTARITGNDGVATAIVGRDADGDISSISLGSGISISTGTLNFASPQRGHSYHSGGTNTSISVGTPEQVNLTTTGTVSTIIADSEFTVQSDGDVQYTGPNDAVLDLFIEYSGTTSSSRAMYYYVAVNGAVVASTRTRQYHNAGNYSAVPIAYTDPDADANDVYSVFAEPVSGGAASITVSDCRIKALKIR